MNAESRIISRIDKPIGHEDPLKPYEKEIFDGCGKYLRFQLREDDFSDIYDEKEISGDKSWVEFKKKDKKLKTDRGLGLESIMIGAAENSDWFGESSQLIPVSEFDDWKAQGDVVLEIKKEDCSVVRILIDVTASGDKAKIEEKMNKSFKLLKSDKRLSSIKYFESEHDEYKGRLNNVPLVVAGITPETLKNLCFELKNSKRIEWAKNIIQFYFLDEIHNQLVLLEKAALEKRGELDPSILGNIQDAHEEIVRILEKKESLRPIDFETKASADLSYCVLAG